eukprot:12352017-Alexandrium_andersonii.AAC.1
MVPPGSAQGTAGRAALAALAAWPPPVIVTVWKPFADWLEGHVCRRRCGSPSGQWMGRGGGRVVPGAGG